MNKNGPLWRRSRNAMRGFLRAVAEERSLRTELIASVGAILLLLLLRAAPLWWALTTVLIAAILAAELLNTAIETLADRVSPELDPLIGRAKDFAAAAVLVLSVAALLVTVLLLWAQLG
ncbi:MAG: diacylglycerol kinase [Acidithiobacillus sp.]